jgi:hypothetical protein
MTIGVPPPSTLRLNPLGIVLSGGSRADRTAQGRLAGYTTDDLQLPQSRLQWRAKAIRTGKTETRTVVVVAAGPSLAGRLGPPALWRLLQLRHFA